MPSKTIEIEQSKVSITQELEASDLGVELMDLNPYEIRAKKAIFRKLSNFSHMEEVFWTQKSRVYWLKEGEKTYYFFSFFIKWLM